MDKDLAEYVGRTAFRSSSEISKLIPLLKDQLDRDEYEAYAKSIAKILELLGTDVLFKIYKEHPDIEMDFKQSVKRFGKLS